jgi:AI-2 transport protein TqsA
MVGGTNNTEGLRSAGLAIIALGVVLTGLVYGRTFLVPLAISILLWNLLEAMIERLASICVYEFEVPRWLAAMLGLIVVGFGLYLILSIFLGQVDDVNAAWPHYVARLESIVSNLTQWLGAEQSAKIRMAITEIDLTRRLPGVFASAQSFVVTVLLVVAYVGFLFADSGYMTQKLAAMLLRQRSFGLATAVSR